MKQYAKNIQTGSKPTQSDPHFEQVKQRTKDLYDSHKKHTERDQRSATRPDQAGQPDV